MFCFSSQMISKEGWKPITNVDKDKPWTAEEVDMMFTVEGKVEDMLIKRHVILASSSSTCKTLAMHLAVHPHSLYVHSHGFVICMVQEACPF